MICIPRSLFLRKTTSNCAGPALRTPPGPAETIDITSYAEVVLAPSASDALHPAFSNLFVQTELIPRQRAILCTRRPRSLEEQTPWMFHLMTADGADIAEVSYETDRMKFIGRGRTVANPKVMSGRSTLSGALSGSEGPVLDPIVAIRYRITLEPEASATVLAPRREPRRLLGLSEKYHDRRLADRVFELAWTHSQVAPAADQRDGVPTHTYTDALPAL